MRVKTPSRIHMTLIDLNGSLGRIDGGVGFALDSPCVEIVVEESDDVLVKGNAFNLERFERVAKLLASKFGRGIEIEVISDYRAHVGLGSGTQISLAVAKAFNDLYDLGFSIRELARLVGRGGTSGIGVAVFEHGGFIVDGGHSMKEKTTFLPSSASKARPAPVISRLDFPDWKIVLAIPNLSGFHGGREVNLFEELCPIPLDDVRVLCHLILMKLLPAVAECDLDEFNSAVKEIQKLGFKRGEIEKYGEVIRSVLDEFPAGMSSTGPTVYAVTDTNAKALARDIKSIFHEMGIECETSITGGRNVGAIISS